MFYEYTKSRGNDMIGLRLGASLLAVILVLGATSAAFAQVGHVSPDHGITGPPPPPPPPPPPAPPPPEPTPPYAITFGAGQSAITPAAKAVLKQAADNAVGAAAEGADYLSRLTQYNTQMKGWGANIPDQTSAYAQIKATYAAKVSVVGYARTAHSTAHDKALALRRAQAAAAALERLGVKRAAIAISAKAKAAPAPAGDPMTQHPQNGVAVLVAY
jgi:OOP family OmpA-OmpF porin